MANRLSPAYEVALDEYPTALVSSRDGQTLAVGTAAGTLQLFSPSSGELLAEQAAHRNGVLALAYGRKWLASAGQDGHVRLWNARDLSPLAALPLPGAWVQHLAVSPNGQWLAAASGKQLCLFNERGDLHQQHSCAAGINGLSFNATGGVLAIASGTALTLLRCHDGGVERQLPYHSTLIAAQYSPDGKVVVAGSVDKSVHFWRAGSWQDSQMGGYLTRPNLLAFSSDSKLLATNGDEPVIVWNFSGKGPEGVAPLQLNGHLQPVTALAFHPKLPLLLSGSKDGSLMFWEPKKNTAPQGLQLLKQEVSSVAFHPAAKLLFAGGAQGRLFGFWWED